MPNFLSIHHEPTASREKIEVRWLGLAEEMRGIWVKTWYNMDMGKRFCWWDAPARETLEEIFRDHGVTWEEIMPVEFSVPSSGLDENPAFDVRSTNKDSRDPG